MSCEPTPNSLDVFHAPDPAVKGRNKVIYNRAAEIHCHHLAAGVALVKLSHHFFFHSPPRRTDLYAVLQTKLNIMVKKPQFKKKKKSSHFTVIIIIKLTN